MICVRQTDDGETFNRIHCCGQVKNPSSYMKAGMLPMLLRFRRDRTFRYFKPILCEADERRTLAFFS